MVRRTSGWRVAWRPVPEVFCVEIRLVKGVSTVMLPGDIPEIQVTRPPDLKMIALVAVGCCAELDL